MHNKQPPTFNDLPQQCSYHTLESAGPGWTPDSWLCSGLLHLSSFQDPD